MFERRTKLPSHYRSESPCIEVLAGNPRSQPSFAVECSGRTPGRPMKVDTELQACLIAQASGTRVHETGEFIFRQGEESSGLFLIKSGAARLFLESETKKRVMERLVTEGSMLGLPSTISAEPYSLAAVATERTELICISRTNLSDLMRKDTVSAFKLL